MKIEILRDCEKKQKRWIVSLGRCGSGLLALVAAMLLALAFAAACVRGPTPIAISTPAPTFQPTPTPSPSAALPPSPTAIPTFRIGIVHTSENHGRWQPGSVEGASQGGIARRATLFQKVRAEGGNVLFLDSGDISQGTLFFSVYKHAEGREFYNLLGYDAVSPGNHEFDFGPEVFAENFVKDARFSIVLANVDMSGEPALTGKIPPFVVKTVGSERIGLFGMVTHNLPPRVRTIRMKDPVATAKEMVTALTAQGVNKIILISHRGYPEDIALASKVDGIDIIVSGHTLTLLGDAEKLDKTLGKPVGPYPTVVKSPSGDPVLVVHAFVWGRTVGRLNVTFNEKGVVTAWDGGLILVDNSFVEDPAVAARVAELARPVEALKKQVIGKSLIDLDGELQAVRNRETNLGNLITDAMLAATAWDNTQIALTNGGAIRVSIKAGDVTIGQIFEALPFENRLVHFDLKGSDLLAALEHGVSRIDLANPGRSSGRFLHVAGLRFTADLTKPVGQRIPKAEVGSTTAGFKPLDPNATYRVVADTFIFYGGSGFAMLERATNVLGGDVPMEEALFEYIRATSPISPRVEGRITLITPASNP